MSLKYVAVCDRCGDQADAHPKTSEMPVRWARHQLWVQTGVGTQSGALSGVLCPKCVSFVREWLERPPSEPVPVEAEEVETISNLNAGHQP